MINADMRFYDYFTLGDSDSYGQPQINVEEPKGQIKMAINISSQSIQDNILFQDCSYIGLTKANIDDTYIIAYGAELLKVLYVNPKGRYNQVFMARMSNG